MPHVPVSRVNSALDHEKYPEVRREMLTNVPVSPPDNTESKPHEAAFFVAVSRVEDARRPIELTCGASDPEVNMEMGEWDFVCRMSKNAAEKLGRALLEAAGIAKPRTRT
jgi:hypothetical protein